MSTGMAGVGFFDTGHRTPRTRDWSRPDDPERANPARRETPEEKRKRLWDESCKNEAIRLQALAEEGRRKREAERRRAEVERDNKRRAAEFDSAEFQITAMFDQYGLTRSERSSVEGAITQRRLWTAPMEAVEVATVLAMEIAARRQGQIDGGKDEQA
jgi:hypothetical protein